MPSRAGAAGRTARPPRAAAAVRRPAHGAHGSPSPATARLLLAGILLAATAVRLWNLNGLGANSDEAVYAGQAAAIANDPDLEPLFPIFRAHPLLFQIIVSLGYHAGGGLGVARATSVLFGVATVYVTFRLGRLLFGTTAGLAAAAFLAVMPYHVVVTRQLLLDGPMVLFATLTLYLLARYATTADARWLHAAAGVLGLTVLVKETSILLVGAIFVFFALAPEVRFRARQVVVAATILCVAVLPLPLVLQLAGSTRTGGNYLAWQLFRRPNHDFAFYPVTVPAAIGPLVVVAALGGLWLLRNRRSWRETLLLSWIVVPTAFFELWPVKGYQYLLPIAPAVAVLAGRAATELVHRLPGRVARRWSAGVRVAVPAGLIVLTLLPVTLDRITASPSGTALAGAGGLPGGREAGRWLKRNVPAGAELMTIGPSMANVMAFYGHHRAYGLSVSPNPLSRNPSYTALVNPDLAVREGRVQYAVWDAFSESRSPFFARRLLRYVERYRGRIVHQETLPVRTSRGETARKPVIVVYVLRR
jgi:4-amino-4-deoxy-L-arabinose transferase-like glycosyltransferase